MTQEPGWADNIVHPTGLSGKIIPRQGQTIIPPAHPQFERIQRIATLCAAGKFASAAHLLREHRAENPWINGSECGQSRGTIHGKANSQLIGS